MIDSTIKQANTGTTSMQFHCDYHNMNSNQLIVQLVKAVNAFIIHNLIELHALVSVLLERHIG